MKALMGKSSKRQLAGSKAKRRGKSIKVAFVFIIFFYLIYAVTLSFYSSRQEVIAKDKAEECLSYIDEKDHKKAYEECFGEKYTKVYAMNDFDLNMQLTHDLLGQLNNRKLLSSKAKINLFDSKLTVNFFYDSNFEGDARAKETIQLVHSLQSDKWLIDSYLVDSDRMIKY